ncbi:hypothetical protein RvY_15865 [Ramazzottius varieornatus]|uniref:Receptor-binding cancer antigen expressed on SiSo cells n=1 Tax=Ramazzottius varieornatus TaxID=947166 RepID=A0A1D1VWE9_RAMVA|nr:hypothetical protein RvY_15865 [Ramazzottius varieornatus]
MKCKSPIALFVQCLKSIWRIIFGRKRLASGELSQHVPATNSNNLVGFAGVTVDHVPSSHAGTSSVTNNSSWQDWNTDLSASTCRYQYPSSAGGEVPTNFSPVDAWRQSVIQQKAQAPVSNVEEEIHFFDDMAPKVQKQKKISLKASSEEALQSNPSPRLAFNAVGTVNLGLSEWVDNETENNWDVEELDPREVRKASRKLAREHTSASGHYAS